MDNPFEFDIISSYTRKEAIQDGYLIDVTDTARIAGITCPVVITKALWEEYINRDDPIGRLWDVLWIFKLEAMHQSIDELTFSVSFEKDGKAELVTLWAMCGPGDLYEPVITIMLPEDY